MGLLRLVLVLGLAACAFDPGLDGRYACGPKDACPPGLRCATDRVCRAGGDDDLGLRDVASDLAPPDDVADLARACPPAKCDDNHCGDLLDACGRTTTCPAMCHGRDKTCGGGGPNRCGNAACAPTTCAAAGRTCGKLSDGCAHVLDCGPPC